MTGATHFIEQIKNKDNPMQGVLCEIKDLQRNLKITAGSPDLKTIAVWKIKFHSINDIPDTVG
mgnify:CR=1 FL=1